MKRVLVLCLLAAAAAGCSYSGPYVTKISAGPHGTLNVETAEVCHDWIFGLLWTVNRRTEQIAVVPPGR